MTTPPNATQDRRPAAEWHVRGGALSSHRPMVMGIVNVTPDSFSDGGRFLDVDAAVSHASAMVREGADIIDVGGESTRPGAEAVDADEQLRRVIPVIERLAATGAVISVDTTLASVARRALDAGAAIVNDVSGGLADPALLPLVAERGAGVVLMHRPVAPRDDRYSDRHATPPPYSDVVTDVRVALCSRRDAALAVGVAHAAIALDPGLGFGKDVAQNLALMARLAELVAEHPLILVGASRKSFIGAVAGGDGAVRPTAERLPGSLAAAVACLMSGATIFRVHDVASTRQAIDVAAAIVRAGGIGPAEAERKPSGLP